MKVLNHGRYYDGRIEKNCDYCGCRFSIERSDLTKYDKAKKVYDWWLGFSVKYDYYFTCPDCGTSQDIESHEVDLLTKFERKAK